MSAENRKRGVQLGNGCEEEQIRLKPRVQGAYSRGAGEGERSALLQKCQKEAQPGIRLFKSKAIEQQNEEKRNLLGRQREIGEAHEKRR